MYKYRYVIVSVFLVITLSVAVFAACTGSSRAVQIESLAAGLQDTDGLPISGGKVYTYAAGTTTAKSVYLDSSCASAATNPVVLDSYGQARVYADGLYKFTVQTSSGNALFTFDQLAYSYFSPNYTGVLTVNGTIKAINAGTAIVVDQAIQAYDAGGIEFKTDDSIVRLTVKDNGDVSVNHSLLTNEIKSISGTLVVSNNMRVSGNLVISGNLTFATVNVATIVSLNAVNLVSSMNIMKPWTAVPAYVAEGYFVTASLGGSGWHTPTLTVVYDPTSMIPNESPSINVTANGYYIVMAQISTVSDPSDATDQNLIMEVYRNGEEILFSQFRVSTGGASSDVYPQHAGATRLVYLNAGDSLYLRYQCARAGGDTHTRKGGAGSSYFGIARLY